MAQKRSISAPQDFWKKSKTERAAILLTETQQDCCFVFESTEPPGSSIKRLYSYKWFLSSCSPVFRTMFNGNFQESTDAMNIKIDDISFEHFHLFLELLNGNYHPTQWSECFCDAVLYILDKYMMTFFTKKIRPFIDNTKDPITVFKWNKVEKLDNCKISFQEKIIMDPRLGQFDLKTFIEFITSLDFTGPENHQFNHFNQFRLIETYINAKGYNVDLSASEPMVKIQNNNSNGKKTIIKSHREIVDDLLKFVKFHLMSVKEFFDGPYHSNLLSAEKKLFILEKIMKRLNLHQTH